MESRATGPAGSRPDSELDALFLEALAAFETGGEAAVERLLGLHPALADALRARIELLRGAGLWAANGARSAAHAPERLGQFRLERLLGAGGMGVVYLAVQEPLGRHVALKIVRPEQLFFPGARERFQREVEIVARLQHPGIVPVYAVGEQQGVPYFAMEYVPGRTLEQALSALAPRAPASLRGSDLAQDASASNWLFEGSWEDTCLRIVRQVAEALEHAHRRGVLHRDVKPSNILLTSDGSSRALLFDFGLAAGTGDATLTKSGARVGSLPYMAPEQARGEVEAVDARSDVYALGATLYELLTLQRAFRGKSEHELLRAIELGQRRPPRAWNPALSAAAETVCLTAMEVDPARRYASAAAFANDLGNVLERRPIEAQRASPWRVLGLWVLRHPWPATAIALGALLVLIGPSIWLWQAKARAADLQRFTRELESQLTATRAAEVAATAEGQRAQRAAVRAREAIREFLRKVGNEYLKSVPRSDALRTELLTDAVRLNEEMVADDPRDAEARAELAVSLRSLGQRHSELGDSARADECLARSAELLRALNAQAPDDRRWMLLLGKTLGQGAVLRVARQAADARVEKDAAQAVALFERCVELDGADVDARHDLAAGLMSLAGMRQLAGDALGAVELYARAEEHAVIVAAQDRTLRKLLAATRTNLAGALDEVGQDEAALAAWQRVDLLASEVLAEDPTVIETRLSAAFSALGTAVSLEKLGRLAEAREAGDQAVARFEALTGDFPRQVFFARELAHALFVRWSCGDPTAPGADALGTRSAEIYRSVLQSAPDDRSARTGLAQLARELGTAWFERGDGAAASELVLSTVDALLEHAGAQGPAEVRGELLHLLQGALAVRGLAPEAGGLARTLSSRLVGLFPGDPELAELLADAGDP